MAFPEAKAILAVRDSEEEWLDSCKRQGKLFRDLPSYVKIAL